MQKQSYKQFIKSLKCIDDNDRDMSEAITALCLEPADAVYYYYSRSIKLNRVYMKKHAENYYYFGFPTFPYIDCDVITNFHTNNKDVQCSIMVNNIEYPIDSYMIINICHIKKYDGLFLFKYMKNQEPKTFTFYYTGIVFDSKPRLTFINNYDDILQL